MRGTLQIDIERREIRGIIPAYAGNTNRVGSSGRARGDHPRVCGEHISIDALYWSLRGSSPRMRGTHMICRALIIGDGDHPRVCGEHHGLYYDYVDKWGSSPRMRGTRCMCAVAQQTLGIIPAYAGNTLVLFAHVRHHGDHPRVCGEHLCSKCNSSFMTGSSPRMRGTPCLGWRVDWFEGIIPAYAGNTRARSSRH